MALLKEILYKVAITEVAGNTGIEINHLQFDSRKITQSDLFFAIRGTISDGHAFIQTAIDAGAVAIICEEIPEKKLDSITYVVVADSSVAMGIIAANFYNHPSQQLKLVGITGTNGKTTTATLLFNLFTALGYRCGMLSTVENKIGDKIIEASHTTPDSIRINELLAQMVDEGCSYCFMEVSSHALVQQRTAGLDFSGGVFTNISHDHLDFHKTFDEYIKAKKLFFDQLPSNAFALINSDDKRGMVMLQNTKAHQKTYSLRSMADFKAKVLENQFSGMLLTIDEEQVWFRLVGIFNAYNMLAVYATAMLLDQDKLKVLTALSKINGAEGRFDYMISPTKVIGIVDYAHTPDAVQNVLETISAIRQGNEQLITVLGCGGDRDRTKRPLMAKVACEWSNKVILTSDNPRSENPETILQEMKEGVSPAYQSKTLTISDRKEAIRTAVMLAKPGDIIVLAGKGHEKYQEIKGVRYPFDDKQVLRELLEFNP